MDRGLQHDGTCVTVFFQHVKQSRCKAEVARLEFRRILRTVDSNKIEHEIRLAAVFLKLRGHTVNIIFVDFIDHNMRACAVLAVVYVFEFFHKIFANEPFAPVTSIFIKRTYAFFFIVSQNSVLSSIFRKFVSVKMK